MRTSVLLFDGYRPAEGILVSISDKAAGELIKNGLSDYESGETYVPDLSAIDLRRCRPEIEDIFAACRTQMPQKDQLARALGQFDYLAFGKDIEDLLSKAEASAAHGEEPDDGDQAKLDL
jgi:hypothetical protein